ncbi:MAG: ABC transporter substrate-binding protein, partial [Deinococcales bacterium]
AVDLWVHSLIRVAFSDVSSIEIVYPYTLVLHLTLPAMDPVPALATMFTAMLSPASVKEHGNTYRTIHWPVGTGPYRFASYRKETRVVMDRFEGYWGRKSYYPHVEFQIVPSSATRRAMLLAGQTDMAVAPSLSDLAALKADPRVDVSLTPSDLSFYVGLNTSRPPLDDVRVRQALNYAVNKAAIIHDVLHDTVTRADSVVPASVFGYARLRPYVYDPAKAKALLADAGVKPGSLTLHMIVPTNQATAA